MTALTAITDDENEAADRWDDGLIARRAGGRDDSGLRDEETFRLDDYRERVHYRIIPADSLRALAERQPRYTRQRYRMAQAERGVSLQATPESIVVRAVGSVPR